MWQRIRNLFGKKAARDGLTSKRSFPDAAANAAPAQQGVAPDAGAHAGAIYVAAPSFPRAAQPTPQPEIALPSSALPGQSEHAAAPPSAPLAPERAPAASTGASVIAGPDTEQGELVKVDQEVVDELGDADEDEEIDEGDDSDEVDVDDEATDDEDSADEDAVQQPERAERRYAVGDRTSFGEELWGVSARHLTAGLDAAKLARFDLPVLGSERELADWLSVPLSRLRWYTHDRPADTTWHYIRYVVRKRSGGERVILAPKRELKALQRKVLSDILARVPTASTTHGFVPGRSVVTNARPHVGKQIVLRLDLKDFFPSITFPRVRGLFIALGYPFPVASALALLCTEYDREEYEHEGTRYFISVGPRHLVQGAPTSPALANLVAWRLDRRLGGLAARHGFAFTRYADDLTFSSDDTSAVTDLLKRAQRIIHDERFAVNRAKTRLARRSARQVVTGLVVNDEIATPRELRRRLRATLHNAEKAGLEAQNREGRADYYGYLQGLIAFVNAANPRHALWLRSSLRRAAANGKQSSGRGTEQ
jgi:retron-type reverse transcriptase